MEYKLTLINFIQYIILNVARIDWGLIILWLETALETGITDPKIGIDDPFPDHCEIPMFSLQIFVTRQHTHGRLIIIVSYIYVSRPTLIKAVNTLIIVTTEDINPL